MSGWRKIPARDIKVGDIVSVRGITNRASIILHVTSIDRTHEREVLVVDGRRPFAGSFRHAFRHVHPEAFVELLIEDDDPNEDR